MIGKFALCAALALCLWTACRRDAGPPGSVQITSTPPGASVFIDNRFAGVTPLLARGLAPGAHAVRLEKKNYRRYYGTVTVAAAGVRLDVPLEAERSSEIRIASLPSGAKVFVNGRYRAQTPVVLSNLPAGSYALRLQHHNCDAWLRTVHVRTGEKIALQAEMESPAEKYLRGAIAEKPNDPANYTELARHFILRKKHDQAIAIYRMAFARRDRGMDSRLYQEIGRAYAGQFKSAEDDADLDALRTKIVRMFADSGNAATFYTNVQRWAKEFAVQLAPETEKAALDRIEQLEGQLAQGPEDVVARLALGKLYLDRRDMKRAQEQFQLVAQATEKNWMTEAELRQEAAQLAKGLVKVNGRWVSAKEAERILLAKGQTDQARRILLEQQRAEREKAARLAQEKAQREAEELARKQQAEKARRDAEELAKKQQAEKARREAEQLAKKQQEEKAKGVAFAPTAFTPAEREWPVDTFQAGVTWQPETWADPATLQVVPSNAGKALAIHYEGGKQAKACVSRPIPSPLDISSRGRLEFDVINNSNTLAVVSLLITTDQDYESTPQFIRPGGRQRLSFPVQGRHFKCKQDNWDKHAFAIAQPQNVTRLGLMLNSPANLLVKNIKLTK